tara:strand:- start:14235 stop:15500 length:1266 start_codon:yes stop_codon:yes gene_type:complete
MKSKQIKIIGDIMLDTWVDGKFERKSPEAPINIFQSNKTTYSLGGVGNLSVNLKSLKIKHTLLTDIGKDSIGNKIIKYLKNEKIKFITSRSKNISTSKERFYCKDKQIFRKDIEDSFKNFKASNKIINSIKKNDFVVISDYKKGLINKQVVDQLNKKNCKIFVDPKNTPMTYKNVFLIKPNMEKFEEWCGKFSEKKAFSLLKKMNWHWLIISHNKHGVYVFNKFGMKNFYRVKQVRNPNVVGAGDIFFAGIIYNYLKKFDIFSCVELSSYAASKCVNKKKIRKININDFKKEIIFTNGVFDILHTGHIDLLKFSKKLGKKLIVGINSDQSVKLNKGKNRPYNNLFLRIRNLKKTKLTNEIIFFKEKTPIKLIKKIKPDVIVKGSDYSFSEIAGNKVANIIIFKKKNKMSSTKKLMKMNKLN